MTMRCSLYNIPALTHFYKEISRELNKSRIWMNHHEVVDFTVFEFGKRTVFLQSRLCLLTLTLISTCYIYPSILMTSPGASPVVPLVYMHTWLFTLLSLHQILELIALTYIYYKVPTCTLVRMHQTPWYFKVTWFMHNTLTANLMSCNLMYTLCFADIAKFVGYFHMMCQVIITVVIGVNVCLVAIPSRLTHIYQPMGLTVVHLLWTLVFQRLGLTNADGQNFVYKNLDWNNTYTALIFSIIWLLLTIVCHFLCVLTCWSRRVVFRTHRKKTKSVYGMDMSDYYAIETDSVHCPQHWKSSKHQRCYKGCLSFEPEEFHPYMMLSYDPHQSYREADATLKRSPSEGNDTGCSENASNGSSEPVWSTFSHLYFGSTSESSLSAQGLGSSTDQATCSETSQCATPLPTTKKMSERKLKRRIGALRKMRHQRYLKVRHWSLKRKYVGLNGEDVAPAGNARLGHNSGRPDLFDVERQWGDFDMGGALGRHKRSPEDEDVESEDNDDSLDQDLDDSSSDSIFL